MTVTKDSTARCIVPGGFDAREFAHRAESLYDRIAGLSSRGAHEYYISIGLSPDEALNAYVMAKRFLAMSAAWQSLGTASSLPVPSATVLSGLHGLILQTQDYDELTRRLGMPVKHAVTGLGSPEDVALYGDLLEMIFGDDSQLEENRAEVPMGR